jgi:hypothetical protein
MAKDLKNDRTYVETNSIFFDPVAFGLVAMKEPGFRVTDQFPATLGLGVSPRKGVLLLSLSPQEVENMCERAATVSKEDKVDIEVKRPYLPIIDSEYATIQGSIVRVPAITILVK